MLETYIPSDALKPFVKCFVIVYCKNSMLNSMLPDTSLIMGLRYKGTTSYITTAENKLPFAVMAGLRNSIQLMQDGNDTGNFLVIFNTAGAAAFFKEPLYQLYGEIVALDDLSDFKQLSELEDKLCRAQSSQEMVATVEKFLLSKLQKPKTDLLILNAFQRMQLNNGNIKVKELARDHFLSMDAFEKRFRRIVGASPKQVCNTIRMNKALHIMQHKSLVNTALEAGYYDQAHFTREFRIFTGQTPTDYLKNNDFLQDPGNVR